MTKYRIGRVQLPWTNLEAPIQFPASYPDFALGVKQNKKQIGVKANAKASKRGRSVDLGSVCSPKYVVFGQRYSHFVQLSRA